MTDWSVIVLAGGQSTRLGQDKASATIDGRSLLELVTSSLPAGVALVIEDTPGGGPVAGIAHGLESVTTPIVAILAVDMPFAADLIVKMVAGLDAQGDKYEALIPVDLDGRSQPLCSAYRTASLRAAIAMLPSPHGASVRSVIASLKVFPVRLTVEESASVLDIDTPDDLEAARRTVSVDPEEKCR